VSIHKNKHETHFATILKRTAQEAVHMRELSLAIEDGLGGILSSRNSVLSVDDVRILQDLDVLSQTAEALADFLSKMSDNTPEGLVVDLNEAFDLLKLEQIRNRLLGTSELTASSSQRPGQGNIDLF
jgi:hypothetical protein